MKPIHSRSQLAAALSYAWAVSRRSTAASRSRCIFPSLSASLRRALRTWTMLFMVGVAITPTKAHASFLSGDALDQAADVISWVVLVVVPVVGIVVFWLLHILPERIAEKRKHPQAKAIQCLCLLSLFFGGLLWPIAWLWAYSKPVLYKLAYGTDVDDSHGKPSKEGIELEKLRARVAELESELKTEGHKA